ncbi:hypothetical protein [Nakamurella leprariae]|uniref:Uncharacterized protein n=1 Tax=Nakamurella leprariae TaxID=2803911 RepID=A0A938YB01_9ACTN|nr:hypothetical protein [Nakamurella leprariae]MBM9466281.1 hypothetical protein [Nakamurella leprariae]
MTSGSAVAPSTPQARSAVLIGALVAVLGTVGAVLAVFAGVRTDMVTTVTGTTRLVHLSPGWITGAAGAALVAGIAAVLTGTALVRMRADRSVPEPAGAPLRSGAVVGSGGSR